MIKAIMLAAVMALASATTTPSLWSISNIFDNEVSQFLSGFSYGGISRMIFFEPNQNCLTKMFSITEAIMTLTRLNRELTYLDMFLVIPLKFYNVLSLGYKAAITCLSENPMFPNFTPPTLNPFFLEDTLEGIFSGGVQPVYDQQFWSKTVRTAIALIIQTNGQINRFEWFFFGRLVAYYVFSGAFFTYNLGYYYI